MPAAYIHEQIVKKAIKRFKTLPSGFGDNQDVLEIGAQGPDILFFYNILNVFNKNHIPNKLGVQMHHERIGLFLHHLLLKTKETMGSSYAYLMGFVAHYATDCTIHPFVYAMSNNEDGSENETKHLVLETQFDTWYHQNSGNKGIPRQVSCIKRLTNMQKNDIANVLSDACQKVFPEAGLKPVHVYKTISDMNKVVSTLYSPHKVKYHIFKLIEKIVGHKDIINRHTVAQTLPSYDFLNNKKKSWKNPWDDKNVYTYSFIELFDMAVELSYKYMTTVVDYLENRLTIDEAMHVLGGNSFSSGLPV